MITEKGTYRHRDQPVTELQMSFAQHFQITGTGDYRATLAYDIKREIHESEPAPMSPADHAEDCGHRYEFLLDAYCALRMEELGIPAHLHGALDFERDGRWRAFVAHNRTGGRITTGITVNSGCLNPALLEGKPGEQAFASARLRDRIDAIIAHEFEEDRLGSHGASLQVAHLTKLPISDRARGILQAMSGQLNP